MQQQQTKGVDLAPCGLPIVSLYKQVLTPGTYLAHWDSGDPLDEPVTNRQLHLVHVVATDLAGVVVCMQRGSITWSIGPGEMLVDPVRALTDPHAAAENATNQSGLDQCDGKQLHIAGPQQVP